MDLGETGSNIYNGFSTSSGGSFPDNIEANNLFNALSSTYSGVRNINEVNSVLSSTPLSNGEDYEKLERSRKLSESEFTINSQLGYISLNSALILFKTSKIESQSLLSASLPFLRLDLY